MSIKLYHGSQEIVEFPSIRLSKYNKDFYFGFYCTNIEKQAIRWATRYMGKGVVSKYDYTPNPDLKILTFAEMNEEWLDFVVACRGGTPHDYDIVEGPMADDKIFNFIQDFLDGEITRIAFWELIKFNKPTHQISFHTLKALSTLKFSKGCEVYV